MRLEEAIASIGELDDHLIIAARHPWSVAAEAAVTEPDENLALPVSVKAAGFEYFLEVHVAREVLAVFGANPKALDEKVRLLMHYAEHDAYPDWVYT